MRRSWIAIAILLSAQVAFARNVSVALDQSRAVSAFIPVEGGVIVATAADGTVMTLTIPPDALLSGERITVTPIAFIERLPFSGGLVAAAQLEPGGLQLGRRATLSFKTPLPIPSGAESPIAWSRTGDDFHLYPLEMDPHTVAFKLIHFSGMGVGSGTSADRAAQLKDDPCTAEAVTIQHIQAIYGLERERAQQGLPEDLTVFPRVVEIVTTYFTKTIEPAMAAALASRNDAQLQAAMRSANMWSRHLALFAAAAPGTPFFDAAERAIRDFETRALEIRSDNALAGCIREHKPEEIQTLISPETTPVFAQFRVSTSYGRVPMSFEANQGQSDARVKFLARGPGYNLFLTAGEAVMTLREPLGDKSQPRISVVRMRLVGANRDSQLAGVDPQPGKSNYFIGSDPARWRRDVVNYARVKYAQVYPGIDLIYHGNQRQLEYDFVLAPGADPRRIELAFDGIDRLSLDAEGNLVLTTGHGKIVQHRPLVYQDIAGERRQLEGRYVLRGRRRARFQLAGYDKARSLVIDPVLVYSTYIGGSFDDSGNAIAVDNNRNIYIAGVSNSTNFPICTTPGCPPSLKVGGPGNDVFVAKFNAAGSALLYSTYLGGNLSDVANAITVDAAGSAYITGTTFSNDYPLVDPIHGPNVAGGQSDLFVTKLNAAGNVINYSTCLGGGGTGGFGDDIGNGIAVDATGQAYVTGRTSSSACSGGPSCDAGHGLVGCFIGLQCQTLGFPLTANAFQSNSGGDYDAFVSKLSAAGSTLLYSTFLGGTGHDAGNAIAVTPEGNAYVTGVTYSSTFPGASSSLIQPAMSGISDAFLVKFNVAGNALTFSTYLGGSSSDQANAIALDGTGNAYITGSTSSLDFPGAGSSAIQTTNHGGREDAFVAKLSFAGTALMYSTYLGGTGRGDTISPDDVGRGIAVDGTNAAYVMGDTYSLDFPTAVPIQNNNAGNYDVWVTKVNPAGNALIYSTYLGGGAVEYAHGIAVDSSGNAYVVGTTASGDFPTATPFQANYASGFSDAFVTKISPLTATVTSLMSSLNPSVFGDTVTFSATVTGTGVTGAVQFKDGAADLGTPVTLTGGAASYPTSTLTVGIHSITAVYGGDSTFYTSTSPALSQTIEPPFGAPSGLVATAFQFAPMVLLTWNLVGHANHYEVLRRSTINGAYTVIATADTEYVDNTAVANTTYLYNVRAVDGSGTLSANSSMDPATTVIFTNDPLGAGFTTVKAAHLNELRTAVNAMRFSAELIPASYPYTDPSIGSLTMIKAVHISELRTALNAARGALGLASGAYIDNTLTATVTPIKAVHFQELRDRTK